MEEYEWWIDIYFTIEDQRAKVKKNEEVIVVNRYKQEAIEEAKHIINKVYNQFTIKFDKITAEKKEDIVLW